MWPTIVLSLLFPCRNFCAENFVIFFYKIKLLFTLFYFNVHFKSFKTSSVNYPNFTLFHIYLPVFQAYHPLCFSPLWLKEDLNCKKHQVLNYTFFWDVFVLIRRILWNILNSCRLFSLHVYAYFTNVRH